MLGGMENGMRGMCTPALRLSIAARNGAVLRALGPHEVLSQPGQQLQVSISPILVVEEGGTGGGAATTGSGKEISDGSKNSTLYCASAISILFDTSDS